MGVRISSFRELYTPLSIDPTGCPLVVEQVIRPRSTHRLLEHLKQEGDHLHSFKAVLRIQMDPFHLASGS